MRWTKPPRGLARVYEYDEEPPTERVANIEGDLERWWEVLEGLSHAPEEPRVGEDLE